MVAALHGCNDVWLVRTYRNTSDCELGSYLEHATGGRRAEDGRRIAKGIIKKRTKKRREGKDEYVDTV